MQRGGCAVVDLLMLIERRVRPRGMIVYVPEFTFVHDPGRKWGWDYVDDRIEFYARMDGIKAVKRHNAQYDIFNRLHSIASDQDFVQEVSEGWYGGRFEVVRMSI